VLGLPAGYAGHIGVVSRPDTEGDRNRGWQTDVLEVTADREQAGVATIACRDCPEGRRKSQRPDYGAGSFRG